MSSNIEEQPLDLSMAATKKERKKVVTKTTPKAASFIPNLYIVGERLFDNYGNKYR